MTTKKTAATKARTALKKLAAKKSAVKAKPVAKGPGKSAGKDTLQQAAKKSKKEHKKKVVRDSFTMPQDEYAKIAEIKAICLKAKMHIKKSEVLRAGLKVLAELSVPQLKHALASLERIKTGRPNKQ